MSEIEDGKAIRGNYRAYTFRLLQPYDDVMQCELVFNAIVLDRSDDDPARRESFAVVVSGDKATVDAFYRIYANGGRAYNIKIE